MQIAAPKLVVARLRPLLDNYYFRLELNPSSFNIPQHDLTTGVLSVIPIKDFPDPWYVELEMLRYKIPMRFSINPSWGNPPFVVSFKIYSYLEAPVGTHLFEILGTPGIGPRPPFGSGHGPGDDVRCPFAVRISQGDC